MYICNIYVYIPRYIYIYIYIFARKNFYRDKRVSLLLEIWEGAVNLLMRSRGQGFKKTWKLMSPRRWEVIFPES